MPCDPLYTTIEASAKLVISAIFCRFHGLHPTVRGPGRISMPCDPLYTICCPRRISMPCDSLYTTIEAPAKLLISAIFCGPGRISMHYDHRYTTIEASAKIVISAIFCRFHGL